MENNISKLESWLAVEQLDPCVREELEALKEAYDKDNNDENVLEQINDRFYMDMEFGTAGMRGIMGAGPNRINVHTIRRISQGFADYINDKAKKENIAEPSIAIAYDNRKNSDLFAYEAACVFVANGVKTHLYDRISATPLLSFTVREICTTAGVVLTASHNNKDYNGYKIYNGYGCQCMPDEAELVSAKIDEVDIWTGVSTISDKYKEFEGSVCELVAHAAKQEELLVIIPHEFEEKYCQLVLAESGVKGACEDLTAVYTPLNGTGNKLVRKILEDVNIKSLNIVKEQENPDPAFPTCPEPNPEKIEALKLALEMCQQMQKDGNPPDILIGSDPDGDRLGSMILHGGEYVRLTGNQVGVLLLDYVINCREQAGTMPDAPVFITTIVSTPITGEIAKKHGIETRKVLTGFKNIGDQMNALERDGETERYIFGFEESCGYLSGRYARDKDAPNAALLLCEAAGVCKANKKSLLDRMEELYEEYGYYIDDIDEFVRPGEQGMIEIASIMEEVRGENVLSLFSADVVSKVDYENGKKIDYTENGPKESTISGIPSSNVVEFVLSDGCKILMRPSGTEPKLKAYYTGVGTTAAEAHEKITQMKEVIKGIVE